MSNLSVKFFDKEYSIPSDVVTYVRLVDFTNEIRDNLISSFNRLIGIDVAMIENDDFMIAAINDQVAKFVRKLLENDIYDRTANDYLQGNKGYELFLDTKKKVLKQIISIRRDKLDTYKAGVEGAIYRKEASVTGLDFGIISSSFVNHMIYAYMDASKQTKQEQEALKTYNREIADLDKQAAEYDRQENAYITDNVIPAMNTVFTFFAYELLDKYVSDLIKAGKFDKAALDFINLERSNDLLGNINLAGNKRAVIESAFVACPFNIAVYMHALKLEMLDEDTFETANVFKQGSKIIKFLKESLGAADYPNFVEPNYYSTSLLARYENKSANDILYQHTSSYANTVIREYGKIVKAIDSPNQCRDYLRKLNDDEVLSGEGASKRLANSLVYSITTNDNWNILVKQCGHTDLLERLQALMPAGGRLGSKADCDSHLAKALLNALEAARKDLAESITVKRARAEEERQEAEKAKQKKKIKTTVICCAIVAAIIFAISLPSIIESSKEAKKEAAIETRIQEVTNTLEQKIESQIDDDVVISFHYNEFTGYDTFLKWSFEIKMTKFEKFRKAGGQDEALLLEIMNNCRIIDDIVENENDSFEFRVEVGDEYIDIRNYDDSVNYGDLSSYETFYYEEHRGNRYLHSLNTEYVLDKNSGVVQAAEKEAAYNEALSLMTAQKYDDAIIIFTELGEYKNSASKKIECNDAIAAIIESKYNKASSLTAEGKYSDALLLLDEIGDYKDAVVLKQKCALLTCETGDVITFGTYEQDGNSSNGAETIEWIVLERDGDKALVLSLYCLEQMPFNNTLAPVTWENCSLRKWLNGTFLDNAFSQEEQRQIISTKVLDEGKQTTDKVFLLSEDEAVDYLPSVGYIADATERVSTSHCYWFLRTTGSVSNVAYVSYDGDVGYYVDVDYDWWVRPAMWIEISE